MEVDDQSIQTDTGEACTREGAPGKAAAEGRPAAGCQGERSQRGSSTEGEDPDIAGIVLGPQPHPFLDPDEEL